jgi:tetratricopeptide (TPR) repeat protein
MDRSQSRLKIALTYIVKDDSEAKIFEKSLKSFMPYFDGLYVLVNGLSGKHNEIHKLVKKYNGVSKSANQQNHPELYKKDRKGNLIFYNFNDARAITFAMVPKEFDFISWADTDDLLYGGPQLRLIAENAKAKAMDIVQFTYCYKNKFDDFGKLLKVLVPHQRERLIANNDKMFWASRVHENMISKDQNQPYSAETYIYGEGGCEVAWIHTSIDENDRSLLRNLEILHIQAEEEEYKDPRTIFYLAKTYFDLKEKQYLEQAIEYFNKFIETSGFDIEIAQAYEFKGLIYNIFQDLDSSILHYKKSLEINPLSHTIYLKLAEAYLQKEKLDIAEHYIRIYETMPSIKSQNVVISPEEAEGLYCTVMFNLNFKKRNRKEALKWAQKRHELIPDGILQDMKMIDEVESIAEAFNNVAIYYIKNRDFKTLTDIIKTLPKALEKEPFMKKVMNSYPPIKWSDKSITYFASFYEPHFEEWNGGNLHTGIGGSESAVIYLSEEWVKMGYEVTVYCDTPIDIEINGVKYVKYWKVNWHDEFNTFIVWRAPGLLDFPIKANRIFLDLHDVAYKEHYTQFRINRVDKVFFKSKAHRDQVPQLPDDKAVVISNGIVL